MPRRIERQAAHAPCKCANRVFLPSFEAYGAALVGIIAQTSSVWGRGQDRRAGVGLTGVLRWWFFLCCVGSPTTADHRRPACRRSKSCSSQVVWQSPFALGHVTRRAGSAACHSGSKRGMLLGTIAYHSVASSHAEAVVSAATVATCSRIYRAPRRQRRFQVAGRASASRIIVLAPRGSLDRGGVRDAKPLRNCTGLGGGWRLQFSAAEKRGDFRWLRGMWAPQHSSLSSHPGRRATHSKERGFQLKSRIGGS